MYVMCSDGSGKEERRRRGGEGGEGGSEAGGKENDATEGPHILFCMMLYLTSNNVRKMS